MIPARTEAAAGILKEALATNDQRADLYVMLGREQEQADMYSEAIQSFHRALDLDPQTPYAHYGLGMTLRSQGDLAAARTEFELAVKQNPDDVYAHYQLGRLLMYRNETTEEHTKSSVTYPPISFSSMRADTKWIPSSASAPGVRFGTTWTNPSHMTRFKKY